MTFPRSDPRRAARDLDPLPAEVLSQDERHRATKWMIRWGATTLTREPGADLKYGEYRELRRFEPAPVPLIEVFSRREYSGLGFCQWRRDQETHS